MGKLGEAAVMQLRANIFVEYVTDECVQFSEQFKKLAWDGLGQGKKLSEIFRENGIPPELLGQKRIENFRYQLRKRMKDGRDFSDYRENNGGKQPDDMEITLEEKVRILQHELAYTRQEVEFLKKLQMANTEARKEWELKHRPM